MTRRIVLAALVVASPLATLAAQQTDTLRELWPRRTQKPPLHGRHWMAITGKPLGAAAGAAMFQKGGNAVDASVAMLGATATMWDVLSWGGETQALIYHPKLKKVIAINALGHAPSGATAAFYKAKGYRFPPEHGPLAAVTPGTPGGLMTILAEYGTMSLKDVLTPAIQMADGYAIEAQTANSINTDSNVARIKQWKYAREIYFTHPGAARPGPEAGEIFVQKDLAATLRKLVEAEAQALRAGKSRKEAIYAAYDRFYKGDIAQEIVRGTREEGGLFTMEDLANWKVRIEEPSMTTYKGVEVYKLQPWTQGPALLQALNILENTDVKTMGFNSPKYIHTVYQAMSLAFADRDFYYGDIYTPPEEPTKGLLSKEYAKARFAQINWEKNDPTIKPGDPYPFQGGVNPFAKQLAEWKAEAATDSARRSGQQDRVIPNPDAEAAFYEAFNRGTTSIQAADTSGWVVSITPSGGWIPAVIAGRTGVGLSQRAQSFVTDESQAPFNVIAPGKRPRVTLTPSMALRNGEPFLSFAVQGGDSQDQNLLQFFLNVVEFDMTVQQAVEAPNMNSYQMRSSFGDHESRPGRMLLATSTPDHVRAELRRMGYTLEFQTRTSGPINAIFFDRKHRTFWGGSSNHGEDYGIAW